MRPLSAWELLNAWAEGLRQAPVQRALILLAAACPDISRDTLAQLSIGQRDGHLLQLREWAFGSQLVSLATCPDCGERLELIFDVADIRVGPLIDLSPQEEDYNEAEALSLCIDDYEVSFRLPNSLDLVAITSDEDVTTIHHWLLERCLLTVQRDGETQAFDQLPANIVAAVTEHMAQADPQADVQLDLVCPDCNHQWWAVFDIFSFFWCEINAWVHRTLHEVHRLASAYSWREADILAMSPWRRHYYLELING